MKPPDASRDTGPRESPRTSPPATGRRHGAQEVDEGGVGAVAHQAVLRLLRDVEAGRVAQLDNLVCGAPTDVLTETWPF